MTEEKAEYITQDTPPADKTPQVLTAHEVADLLQVAYKTVCLMAKNGDIPAFTIAGQWRFLKSDIDAWLRTMSRQNYHGPELAEWVDNGEM
jgi:excisionase family DNA binding protein